MASGLASRGICTTGAAGRPADGQRRRNRHRRKVRGRGAVELQRKRSRDDLVGACHAIPMMAAVGIIGGDEIRLAVVATIELHGGRMIEPKADVLGRRRLAASAQTEAILIEGQHVVGQRGSHCCNGPDDLHVVNRAQLQGMDPAKLAGGIEADYVGAGSVGQPRAERRRPQENIAGYRSIGEARATGDCICRIDCMSVGRKNQPGMKRRRRGIAAQFVNWCPGWIQARDRPRALNRHWRSAVQAGHRPATACRRRPIAVRSDRPHAACPRDWCRGAM